MPTRKQFPLRIPQELYDVYERWASDELRSVNAQIEVALREAAARAGRSPRSSSRKQSAGDGSGV